MTHDLTGVEPAARPGSTRAALRSGAVAMSPWLAGIVPFGMIVGVTIAESGVSGPAGFATGPLIFSGSAQIVAIELLADGATPAVIIATVLVMNARLAFYSASIAPHWRGTGRGFRGVAAYLLVDPSFAVGMDRYSHPGDVSRHVHYLGAGMTLWVAWHAAILTGMTLGASLPASLRLELIVPLFLVAEVTDHAADGPGRTAAAVAAPVAMATMALPMHTGLIAAIGAGVAMATFSGRPGR